MLYQLDTKNAALTAVNLKETKELKSVISGIIKEIGIDEFVKVSSKIAKEQGLNWIDLILDAED